MKISQKISFDVSVTLSLCSIMMVCTVSALGQCELDKLIVPEGFYANKLGASVATCGNIALIGAPGDDYNGSGSGSVYVFCFDGARWTKDAKLLPLDGEQYDGFGKSVAIDGDTAVIGARDDDEKGILSGSAYIFYFNGSDWVEQAKLLASDGELGDAFGLSVAISGNIVLIGSGLDDDFGSCSGSAYVFRRDTNGTPFDANDDLWVEQAKLLPSDGASFDYFGDCVEISGDTVLIGARGDDDNGSRSGSVYVFRQDSNDTPLDTNDDFWIEQNKLLPSDGKAGDRFGCSIAIHEDTMVIGAMQGYDGSDSGSAYVFRQDPNGTPPDANDDFWIEQAKLLPSDGAAEDTFGRSVDITGGTIVIGAILGDGDVADSGSAYVFRQDSNETPLDANDDFWVEQAKLLASDGQNIDFFGTSVAVTGYTAIVGQVSYSATGSVYIFAVQCGDFDTDGDVDLVDFDVFASHWQETNCGICGGADIGCDGGVELNDLKEFVRNWLAGVE